jgi:hypothetical protein
MKTPFPTIPAFLTLALAALAPAVQAAATVSFYGYQIDVPGWRSTDVTKTISLNGGGTTTDSDGYYGTDGWGIPTLGGYPAYIAAAAAGTLTANRGGAGYEPIDDPTQPVTGTVADLPAAFRAIAYQTPGAGAEANLFQLTLTNVSATIPSSFLIGVGFGNLATPGENIYGAASYRASVGASTTAQIAAIGNNGLMDWIFFRVDNGLNGDVINIYGKAAEGVNFVSLGALSFDTIPEPGSPLMLGLGAAALACGYRRRR